MSAQAAFSEPYSALQQAVRGWDRRLRATQTLTWLPRSLLPGLALGIGAALVSRARPWLVPQELLNLTGAALVAGVLVMLVIVWAWRRAPILAARRFDVLFNLNERVSTALELIEGRIHADDELTSYQVADAYQRVQAVNAGESMPFRLDPRDWLGVLLLTALFAVLVLVPNPQADMVSANDAQRAAIEEAAEDLRDMTQEVAADPNLADEDRESLLQALDASIDTLEQPEISPEEAFATLSDMQAALEQRAETFEQQASASTEAMQDAAEALREMTEQQSQPQQSPEQQLQDAMNQMMQAMGGMSPEGQQQGANALQQAANAMQGTNPQAAQQMQQAAQSLQNGQTGAAQEQMQQAQESVQQGAQQAQQQQQAGQTAQQQAQQAQQAAEQVAQSGQQQQAGQQSQQQNQQGQEGQQGQQAQQGDQGQPGEQQAGQPGEGEGQPGDDGQQGQQQGEAPGTEGQGQPAQPADGAGQQGDGAQGESQDGAGSGAGDGEGGDGQDNGGSQSQQGTVSQNNNPDGEGESEYAPVFAPRRIGGESGDESIVLEPDGSAAPVVQGEFAQNPNGQSSVPYNEVFADYANTANRALESDYIPLGMRDVVRDYFTSLEPGQSSTTP